MGKHRKQSAPAGRALTAALGVGAVAMSGTSGAFVAHAHTHSSDQAGVRQARVHFAADSQPIVPSSTATPRVADVTVELAAQTAAPTSDGAQPQVLNQDFGVGDPASLSTQLQAAKDAAGARAAADAASRLPSVTSGALALPGAVDLSTGSRVVFPTTGSYTSNFGMRWGVQHKGIDLANAVGTPIYAAMSGTVINAGSASGFGQWVRIKHDDGSITVYGHIETIDVTEGQHVEAGDLIAGMGARGQATGPHLHFEYYPDGVNAVDPAAWLEKYGYTLNYVG